MASSCQLSKCWTSVKHRYSQEILNNLISHNYFVICYRWMKFTYLSRIYIFINSWNHISLSYSAVFAVIGSRGEQCPHFNLNQPNFSTVLCMWWGFIVYVLFDVVDVFIMPAEKTNFLRDHDKAKAWSPELKLRATQSCICSEIFHNKILNCENTRWLLPRRHQSACSVFFSKHVSARLITEQAFLSWETFLELL